MHRRREPIPGTIVQEMTRPETLDRDVVRIGHPAGVINTETQVEMSGNEYVVRRATLGRTARRIMEGYVYPRALDDDEVHAEPVA